MLDLSGLFAPPASEDQRKKSIDVDHAGETLDHRILLAIEPKIARGDAVEVDEPIATKDRTVGARIAGRIRCCVIMEGGEPSRLERSLPFHR